MPLVKHAVMIKFQATTPPALVAEIYADIGRLFGDVPGMLDYSWGPNRSPEGLNRGFTHGFVITFASPAARDAYLVHPAHQAVVQKVLPELDGGIDGALVLDWEV